MHAVHAHEPSVPIRHSEFAVHHHDAAIVVNAVVVERAIDASHTPGLEVGRLEVGPRRHPDAAALNALARRGMPPGLLTVVSEACAACAVRYWVIDNSGSMQTQVALYPFCYCNFVSQSAVFSSSSGREHILAIVHVRINLLKTDLATC